MAVYFPYNFGGESGRSGGDSIQVNALPTASAENLGKVYQYIGETTPNRINGYFYKCVEGSTSGTYEWSNIDVQNNGSGGTNIYYDVIPAHTYLYGFDINTLDSNPDTRVTYPIDVDNFGYSPAYMDFTNDIFVYGDWDLDPGEHFMPRPCMLNTDTTVAYYLNPNNYTKKADDTNSDVTDLTFDGNAMMEWGKIYTYRSMDNNGIYRFRCSDVKLGSKWECWCNYDQQNNVIPHFYTPIYNGVDNNNKIRSISNNGSPCVHLSPENMMSHAKSVGESYCIEVLADRLLIDDLLVLMAKTTDGKRAYGDGRSSSFSYTGALNNKGLFYGDKYNYSGHLGVKVFGMEHYWGNVGRVTAGFITNNGHVYTKITRGTKDGSSASDYNMTGTGYIDNGYFSSSTSYTSYYWSDKVFDYGRLPNIKGAFYYSNGSYTVYNCDYYSISFINDAAYCVLFGRGNYSSYATSDIGPFAIRTVDSTVSQSGSNTYMGCGLSCKPLLA